MDDYEKCLECQDCPRIEEVPFCRACWEWMWSQQDDAEQEATEDLLGEPQWDNEADYEPVTFKRIFMWIGRKGAA